MGGKKQMHLCRRPFWWPCERVGAIEMALPNGNGACPGLPWKPLDTTIWWLLSPYHPRGPQGNSKQNDDKNKHLLCWPFWWPWQCAGRLPRTSLDRGGLGLYLKPLNTAIGQVFAKKEAIRHGYAMFLCFFSWSTCWKRASDDVKTPFNHRGVTNQINQMTGRMWWNT